MSCTCPSSRPQRPRSRVIGIVQDAQGQPIVRFLAHAAPVTDELRALDHAGQPARLTEFLRFASPCACSACAHYQEGACGLARRVAAEAPAVVDIAPPCSIRASCRWRRQEGEAACLRCPGIVTDGFEDEVL
jgi:hypothetical protein